MPVAVNCLVVPRAMIGLTGITSIETRTFDTSKLELPPPLQPNVKLNNSAPHIKKSNLIRELVMAKPLSFFSILKASVNNATLFIWFCQFILGWVWQRVQFPPHGEKHLPYRIMFLTKRALSGAMAQYFTCSRKSSSSSSGIVKPK